jgi:hypothetical protein
MLRRRLSSTSALLVVALLAMPGGARGVPKGSRAVQAYRQALEAQQERFVQDLTRPRSLRALQPVLDDFEIVGHADLGAADTNGDVWVHGDYAYVGTWAEPCNGLGVKVVDVSDPATPTMIGRVAGLPGTSAEDVVVRSISTASFTGDLLVAGIQRCDFEDETLNDDTFGVEIWDVTMPAAPVRLGGIGITTGGGGVHELDMIDRGPNAYVAAATPMSEWFNDPPIPEISIVDVTNPASPAIVGQWGAREEGLSPGPFYGQGSFGSMFAHSARFSDDGTSIYASYWDLGVVTLDVTDPTNPTMVSRSVYPEDADGDTHSLTPYGDVLLANDEDFDPRSPATIGFADGSGVAPEAWYGRPLWRLDGHRLSARIVRPRRQGCDPSNYVGLHAQGKIAVPRTFFEFLGESDAACRLRKQEHVAQRVGAAAVVHDWISSDTSPQPFDFSDPIRIPVLYTDHATARGMLDAGRATLIAGTPAWGFLRVFDAATGEQVATFDDLPYVRTLNHPLGFWSIHNTEVNGDIAYSSWYTHGVVALNLSPLASDPIGDPVLVGQFVPEGGVSHTFLPDGVAIVWGVYPRASDDLVFLSDMLSGLWIVRPIGDAAP